MSVERINRELDGVRCGVADAPLMHLTDEQLSNLSLGDALKTMRQLLGVVQQRQQEDIPVIAAMIPASRAVVRGSAEHVAQVVPLGIDGYHPIIQDVRTALHGTENAMSVAGEHVLAMVHSAEQALGQIALAIGNMKDYEDARTLLVGGVAEAHAGRDRVTAGLDQYQTVVTG